MAIKTVDFGDGKKRPISFKISYSKKIKEQWGSIDELLTKVDLDEWLPAVAFDGLVDKDSLTPDLIADLMDSDLRLVIMSDLWFALTGLRHDFLASRQSALDALVKNIQPPANP